MTTSKCATKTSVRGVPEIQLIEHFGCELRPCQCLRDAEIASLDVQPSWEDNSIHPLMESFFVRSPLGTPLCVTVSL
jgi:hypothetical protein